MICNEIESVMLLVYLEGWEAATSTLANIIATIVGEESASLQVSHQAICRILLPLPLSTVVLCKSSTETSGHQGEYESFQNQQPWQDLEIFFFSSKANDQYI